MEQPNQDTAGQQGGGKEEVIDKKRKNTALATRNDPVVLALESLQDAMQLADWASQSKLVPKDYQGSPQNCLIAFQMGAEVGLHPLQAVQSIAIINGRGAFYGDALLALCRSSAVWSEEHFAEWTEGEFPENNFTAWCRVGRKLPNGEVKVSEESFSIQDAKRAELWQKAGPWSTYPKRQIKFRPRNWLLRDNFSDVLKGFPVFEELRDVEEAEWSEVKQPDAAPQEAPKPASRTEALKQRLKQQEAQQAPKDEPDDAVSRAGLDREKTHQTGKAVKKKADQEAAPKPSKKEEDWPPEPASSNTADMFSQVDEEDDLDKADLHASERLDVMMQELKMDIEDFRRLAMAVTGRDVQQRNHLKQEEILQVLASLAAIDARTQNAAKTKDLISFCDTFSVTLSTREDVEKAWKQYANESARS